MPEQVERFKTRKKALDWLHGQGVKVSTGKFYGDCDKGFPLVGKDGSVSKFQVSEYGRKLDRRIEPAQEAIDKQDYQIRRERADAHMAEMKAERMRREEDENWIHSDSAWAVVAGLIGRLRDCVRHHLYADQGEIVLAAGGELARSQEVFEMMDETVSKAFNEVAGESIEIEFSKESS